MFARRCIWVGAAASTMAGCSKRAPESRMQEPTDAPAKELAFDGVPAEGGPSGGGARHRAAKPAAQTITADKKGFLAGDEEVNAPAVAMEARLEAKSEKQ